MNMRKHAWNLSVPLLFIIVVSLYLIDTRDIRGIESYYPLSVAIAAAVLAVISMWRDRLSKTASSPSIDDESPTETGNLHSVATRSRVKLLVKNPMLISTVLMAIVAISIYLMTWLGFFVPSLIMISTAVVLLGVHKWWKVLTYSIAVVGLAYLLFVVTLNVPFPSGPWG